MPLTSIGSQKTPGRPIEQTFAVDTGIPDSSQQIMLIGHLGAPAASGSAAAYAVYQVQNSGDYIAASGEVATQFGQGSELAKMVLAAIQANRLTGNYVTIMCMPLQYTDVGFGSADVALTNITNIPAAFIVSCYDGTSQSLANKLIAQAQLMSGPQRVENNQFGSFGVFGSTSAATAAALPKYDTQFGCGIWLRDQSNSKTYVVGELAARAGAALAGNQIPFNPVDDVVLNGQTAPVNLSDYLSVGAGLESELCLQQGWTPMKVKPNGSVAFVRSVTCRLTSDGVTLVQSYYDLQDFQVLYYWRKTLFTRFTQPDFKQRKASLQTATLALTEMIRLATLFQDQNMFQAVTQLAQLFQVQRSLTDRHRLDYVTPVNVIPGLHVMAGNIQATTQFDTLSI